MITLCGVIVDDVKNDFDARLVQRFHHLFEFLNLLAVFSGSRVRRAARGNRLNCSPNSFVGRALTDGNLE